MATLGQRLKYKEDTYKGVVHIPGAECDWEITLELDWNGKQVTVVMPEAPGHITTWEGLAVQTFGDYEIAFRTKGIPPRLTHWWHFVRTEQGVVIEVPHIEGDWTTCSTALKKISA